MKRLFTLLLTIGLLAGCATPGDTPAQKRAAIQQMRTTTLNKLYQEQPAARQEIKASAGYAVFSNIGNNLLVLSGGSGYGVAKDRRSGKDIYMKMATLGFGVGAGIKDFQSVIIFRDRATFDDFIEHGWDTGVQTDAAVKSGDKGESVVALAEQAKFDKVRVYHLTESGIALQATVQGYKYWQDDELNGKAPAPVTTAK